MRAPTRPLWSGCLLVLGLQLSAVPAGAHAQYKPFSTNTFAWIILEPTGIDLRYDVTVGDLPARDLRQRHDEDGDGRLSPPERQALEEALRERVLRGLWLRLDEQPVRPRLVAWELELVSDQVELLAPLRLRMRFALELVPGNHLLVYQDGSRLEALEQTELWIDAAQGVRLLRASRPPGERGVVPRMTWEQGAPPGPVWIQFALPARAAAGGAPGLAQAPLADDGLELKRLLAEAGGGPLGMLLALGLAFLLGALHALSPGHGKTLVAAYLVGSRGHPRHAVLLGLTVTTTHVAAVFALGLVALVATERALPDRVLPWLEVASALLVAALGAFMLLGRLRALLLHRLAHAQGTEHDHAHHPGHDLRPGVRLRELLWLGVSGGLVPCPSATVVMLMAIYVGRVGLGLGLLLAFSLGLAATLVALGILVVKARGLAARLSGPRFEALSRWAPALSAGLILALGAGMTVLALTRL
jgi:ABC-type nickel/cobalt efflux system permease component RcnA